jgi:hypothetical protein
VPRDRGEQFGLALEQVLRKVDHDVAELVGQSPARRRPECRQSGAGEVGLVVPVGGQQPAGLLADPNDIVGAAAAGRERGPTLGRHVGQLGEHRHQGQLGGGVLGHRSEHAGVGAQRPAQRGGDDRRRDRSAPGAGERRRAEQLGQPVGREEGHRRHPAATPRHGAEPAAGKQAPSRHPDVVARHHHGDGGQRVAGLGAGDGGA